MSKPVVTRPAHQRAYTVGETLTRCLWLAQYLMRYGTLDLATARAHFGKYATRTYRRDMARLRASGMRIEGIGVPGEGQLGRMRFITCDLVMAEVRLRNYNKNAA